MSTMRVKLKMTGMDGIAKNLDKYLVNLYSNLFDATKQAAEVVRIAANETLTPVDTGLLVNTSFSENYSYIGANDNPAAEIVYIQPYSKKVELNVEGFRHGHEYNMYYGPGLRKETEQSSFLSTAVSRNTKAVYEIIKEAAINVTV